MTLARIVGTDYSEPTFVQGVPGGVVNVVTCMRCGALVLAFSVVDAMTLHDGWHAVQDATMARALAGPPPKGP